MSDERIARERVGQACSMIASAYRLAELDPRDTILSVKVAIQDGVEQHAQDRLVEVREALA